MPTNLPSDGCTNHPCSSRIISFDEKMATIEECAADVLDRSFLHAFVACLTPAETCRALLESLGKPTVLGLAFRNRLFRLAREGRALEEIEALGRTLLGNTPGDGKSAGRRHAHLSQLFVHFSPPTRKAILEHWLNLGTKGALQRWLKAIEHDPLFLEVEEVIALWRRNKTPEAAALIAKHASPSMLSTILLELVEAGSLEWVVSKAALRASTVSEDAWGAIRRGMPATYAYLCVKQKRMMSDIEAIELIEACDPHDQGLAIWAVGQLGMWHVLERIREKAS